MDSGRVIFDCCNHACFDDILDGFDKNKLPCVEVSALLGKMQLCAGVRELIDLGDESCLVLNSSMGRSLEPCSNGCVHCVASCVANSPVLAIVRDNLARPKFTAGCLLCVITVITTKEGRSNCTFSAHQSIIQKAIYLGHQGA